MGKVQLYSYFRSSASYRVRIALHLKEVDFEYHPVHLLNDGGEQYKESYSQLNPSREVPTLIHNDVTLAQSMAILFYLDDQFPNPTLFPQESVARAQVIQLCECVNAGIQPIQNLKVLKKIGEQFELSQDQKNEWVRYWIERGFQGLEKLLEQHSGRYAYGDQITAADLFLVPQIFNARRFSVDMAPFPNLVKVEKNTKTLAAFEKAHPSQQPDSQ